MEISLEFLLSEFCFFPAKKKKRSSLGENSSDLGVDLGESVNIGNLTYKWNQSSWLAVEKAGNPSPMTIRAQIQKLRIFKTNLGNLLLGAQNNDPLIWIK